MRLGVITDEISQDLGRALDVMAEYGCKDAELRNIYNKYIVDAGEADLKRAEAALARHDMTVPCIDTPLFKCNLEEADAGAAAGPTHGAQERGIDEQMHLLHRSIDLCKRFGAPYIRIFSFWRPKGASLTPEIEDRIAAALLAPVEVAQRAGIVLLLENEHACYLGTGAETARVVERIGSPALKMVWDPGNAFMAGEQPFPSGYEAAAPHILHVHVKDARATPEGGLEWTVVGEGDIDYGGQFDALKRAGYTGGVALETHYKAPGGGPEESSRLCLAGLKRLIESA